MTRRLDDVDKGYAKVRTPGGEEELTIISESVALRRDLPI